MADTTGQLVLAQNQYAFIQDATKGTVQVYAGPHALALSSNDKPVTYDNAKDEFVAVNLPQAIKQNPLVPEGHYLVLENPAFDNSGSLINPKVGKSDTALLQVGRKINIPGPPRFPCGRPVRAGHPGPPPPLEPVSRHPRVQRRAGQQERPGVPQGDRPRRGRQASGAGPVQRADDRHQGHRGPVLPPAHGLRGHGRERLRRGYVREALTLERLEYCILLDEDGNKRYERGPQVVFPEATEKYMTKKDNDQGPASRKFKAIELNDQMGLYIKVIADYTEGEGDAAVTYKTGQELFITGKTQRIYYPRPEHALIGYKDPKSGFERQRYYGIAIPRGEGRYVLVKDAGDVKTQKGRRSSCPTRATRPSCAACWITRRSACGTRATRRPLTSTRTSAPCSTTAATTT